MDPAASSSTLRARLSVRRILPGRIGLTAIILVAAAAFLTGCIGFSSYVTETPPEPPLLTEIPPPEDFPKQPPPDLSNLLEAEKSAVSIYYELNRGVVNITSVSVAYSFFFQPYPQSGSGSGAIIDTDGTVLTNYHVIRGAEQLAVTLYDGSRYLAKVTGVDPENDLALLSFDPGGRELVIIPFGTSSDLQVGQMVLALGNPFGLERTLTTGVISGVKRPLQNDYGYLLTDLIQTDASINPGNSGGPLLDSSGNMIGINTMILSPSAGSVGIGFAVPVDTAKRVIPDLAEFGRVRRGWIEIVPVPVFPALAARAGLPIDHGVLVSRAIRGGNAEQAGIRGGNPADFVAFGGMTVYLGGDVIVGIGKAEIRTIQDFYAALEPTSPGDAVDVSLLRNGSQRRVEVILTGRPERTGW